MLEIIKDYKKYIIGFTIMVILILSVVLFSVRKHDVSPSAQNVSKVEKLDNKEEIEEVLEEVQEPKEVKKLTIDIKGAVKKPGIYTLDEGSIINDAIKLAGLKSNGSTKNINLSKKIVDEMVIYVFTNKELENNNNSLNVNDVCNCDDAIISSCSESSVIISSSEDNSNSSSNISGLININKASKDELLTLTGIGESKALAIIKYREENNGFKDISEIMNVSGIGEALYNKIKDRITI